MKVVIDFLVKSQIQYFATIGLDGRPKVRPFQFMMEQAGKLYFCTSNQKKVYAEMQKQPFVELCALVENFSWLRLNGRVVFTQDLAIKEKVQDTSDIVKSIYKTADNPAFEVFYLDEASVTIADLSGKPPQTYEL